MTYAEARAVLDRLPRLEVKPGLARTERLLEVLDHPERAFPSVHVAGTNGKGSIVAMLDAVLRAAGLRVGRYTSPELIDFRDRIVVDGAWFPEAEWTAGIDRMSPALVDTDDLPTQFEAITALAFDTFARQAVDIALVEVGLGGRFDATNLLMPVVSVLSNVSLDHTAILGDSIERIAWEKAGVAKKGVPLLHGALQPAAERVVAEECTNRGALREPVDEISVDRMHVDWEVAQYRIERDGLPGRVDLGLLGGYQRDNLQLALGVVEALRDQGLDLSDAALSQGLRSVQWPGRFEVIQREPNVVLEGAHNVAGARWLVEDMDTLVPRRDDRRLLLGILADKDVRGIGAALARGFETVALTASRSPRALAVDRLSEVVDGLFPHLACYDSIAQALEGLVPVLSANQTLVVAGSLTAVGEARQGFGGTG